MAELDRNLAMPLARVSLKAKGVLFAFLVRHIRYVGRS